ncbi:(2Fe-2S)-binding protein [Motiliproteus sp. SC1-56]|uniref:(2Fe-2S)-binding protein n=1 Tax=Motiliproteus sp. SC1-56 TaxID=2799565 RepID=UPI001A8D5B68|nr:(2Fe-2S)-binding protein [Motiliproteus sp. SC1-56]
MPSDSAFKRLPATPSETVQLWVEGQAVNARRGESVAAAVLAAGLGPTRTTPVSGAPRAPYCMMGICFECLMEIDGRPNTQGCMTPVAEGMQVRFQHGARASQEETA